LGSHGGEFLSLARVTKAMMSKLSGLFDSVFDLLGDPALCSELAALMMNEVTPDWSRAHPM